MTFVKVTLSILLIAGVGEFSLAAVSTTRDSDYLAPSDVTVTRGSVTTCYDRNQKGERSNALLRVFGEACPGMGTTARRADRPEVETVSPGLPFQSDQGLE
ncbi:hypothetical protein [Bdellovibrio bacteriovorus]|uniref:hypothetical protein n=1 Tax=Bdellovibrio bacteriovorus TaxID=959 RepID=UPI0035A64E5E